MSRMECPASKFVLIEKLFSFCKILIFIIGHFFLTDKYFQKRNKKKGGGRYILQTPDWPQFSSSTGQETNIFYHGCIQKKSQEPI